MTSTWYKRYMFLWNKHQRGEHMTKQEVDELAAFEALAKEQYDAA